MRDLSGEKRILAVDPTHRGFGYVVFEGPERLVDWGVSHVQGPKNRASIAAVGELISRYRPQIMILEDVTARDCRRRRRVRDLLEALDRYGRERGLTVRRIAQAKVKRAFAVSNKARMARAIAARFPELSSCLPPERKPWMSEDLRMAIFDAAAFGLTFFSGWRSSS